MSYRLTLAVLLAFGAGAALQQASAGDKSPDTATEALGSANNGPSKLEAVDRGRALFMKNCAHCHGEDARGDEGPDLHGLRKSDEWIARRIRNGLKGEMTAFGDKFSQEDMNALVAFLRSLR